ncbi:MAG: class I SAM-dependent methyltransferase [Candidatus Omnitrophica bacterium]|nr:class I SAM-dependent methyltransferase [Candidatus Omnitrophota bacterium]
MKSPANLSKENIFGHAQRLRWIISHLNTNDKIIEIGCGTGVMITLPLLKLGFSVVGIDSDRKSIEYGKEVFIREGVNPNGLRFQDALSLDLKADVIIVSELLEHIPGEKLDSLLQVFKRAINKGGRMLVTVPNGRGWFEFESLIWNKGKVGVFLEKARIKQNIIRFKRLILGYDFETTLSATLSESPHLQRFTFISALELLRRNDFLVREARGSVLFCGPLSNTLFTGIAPVMKMNCMLGRLFLRNSAGFYFLAEVSQC